MRILHFSSPPLSNKSQWQKRPGTAPVKNPTRIEMQPAATKD
jgi:hypothetical protein